MYDCLNQSRLGHMAIPSPTNDRLAGSLVDPVLRDSTGEIASIFLRDPPQGRYGTVSSLSLARDAFLDSSCKSRRKVRG